MLNFFGTQNCPLQGGGYFLGGVLYLLGGFIRGGVYLLPCLSLSRHNDKHREERFRRVFVGVWLLAAGGVEVGLCWFLSVSQVEGGGRCSDWKWMCVFSSFQSSHPHCLFRPWPRGWRPRGRCGTTRRRAAGRRRPSTSCSAPTATKNCPTTRAGGYPYPPSINFFPPPLLPQRTIARGNHRFTLNAMSSF